MILFVEIQEKSIKALSKTMKKVSDQIAPYFKNHVNFPQTEAKWTTIQLYIIQNLYDIAGIPGVGGCIDYIYTSKNPGGINGEIFRNFIG